MLHCEIKPIQAYSDGNNLYGMIELKNLAEPSSVLVYVKEEQWYPNSFNLYGYPIFTKEQLDIFGYKEDEFNRESNDKSKRFSAVVVYEDREFNVPRHLFDSIEGIKESLKSLSSFYEMLENRLIFKKAYATDLNTFVVFGKYVLDEFGQVWVPSIYNRIEPPKPIDDVEDKEAFFSRISTESSFGWGLGTVSNTIPKEGAICPCCSVKFNISDVRHHRCSCINGVFYHSSCWDQYRRIQEIKKFDNNLFNFLYKKSDYTYDLLPNGYCDQPCCANIPWFMFHTIDGDIKIGWRKRVISIEWQKNFKDFDFEALFGDEDVTKWQQGKVRGIHAWGSEKAYEYLSKVQKAVNPNYSKWN